MSDYASPSADFTLLSADVTRDPYPLYHSIRSAHPVYFDPQLQRWLISGYDEVRTVLSDSRFSSTVVTRAFDAGEERASTPVGRYLAATMLTNDPPKHTRLRNLVGKAFTPKVIERLRVRIQSLTDALLDRAQSAGQMDLMRDFAYPLPIQVIIELIGAELEMAEQLKAWTSAIVRLVGSPKATPEMLDSANRSVVERNEYLLGIAAQRKSRPRPDLISALVSIEEDGDRLSDEEICATCGLLLGAGHETTSNLIGNGMLAMLRHPPQLARLREQPDLIPSAVEEFLRYDGPLQWNARLALDDAEVGGVRLQGGDVVLIGLGAANRDPAQFAHPDVLDITRQPNRHIAFGHGIHFCLGAALARIEGQIAIETLLRRLPQIQLVEQEFQWHPNLFVRGLQALAVRF